MLPWLRCVPSARLAAAGRSLAKAGCSAVAGPDSFGLSKASGVRVFRSQNCCCSREEGAALVPGTGLPLGCSWGEERWGWACHGSAGLVQPSVGSARWF